MCDPDNDRPAYLARGVGELPHCLPLLLALLFGIFSPPSLAQETQWDGIRGINFIPGYARNAYETWAQYDGAATARELRLAKRLGFNSVRLWLHADAYFDNPTGFLDSLEDCLDSCERLGLTAMPVLFDSCGIEPDPARRVLPMRLAFEESLRSADSDLERETLLNFARRTALEFAPDTLVPLGDDTSLFFWEWWRPNPGDSRCLRQGYPPLEQYARAIIERFDDHPAVLIWDIHNEPTTTGHVPDFVRHMSAVAKNMSPSKPITVGSEGTPATAMFAEEVDVLSFHTYQTGDGISADFAEAERISRAHGDKPILLTEFLANTMFDPPTKADLSRDDGQLMHYRENLPRVLDSGAGWYSWGLVVGNLFAASTDIVYPNGFKRPAGAYLQAMLEEDEETADLFTPRIDAVPNELAGSVLVSQEPLVVAGETQWDRLHAVDFVPSYARNAIDSWQSYDAETVDRELGFAKSLGFNGVRAWLHQRAYERDPHEFLERVEDFLTRCDAHDLYAVMVVFDQRGHEYSLDGAEPISWGAKLAHHESRPEDARWVESFKARAGKNWPALAALSRDMTVPHPAPRGVLLTQWWYPNPGPSQLGEDSWPGMAGYAKALVDRFGHHPRVLAWEALHETEEQPAYQAFGRRVASFVRAMHPEAPVTIGAASLDAARRYVDEVDLISFRSHETGDDLSDRLAEARQLSGQAGKAIIATGSLANSPTSDWYDGTDWGQLARYRRTLPVLANGGVGWVSKGLVSGSAPESFLGVMYPAGFRRPAANFLSLSLGGLAVSR